MDQERLDALRDYYETMDLTSELEKAELDTDAAQSPMVGITVRFPAEVLQQVRAVATAVGVKPTALIRIWVEQRLDSDKTRVRGKVHKFNQVIVGAPGFGETSVIDEFRSVLVARYEEHTDSAESESFVQRSAEYAAMRG